MSKNEGDTLESVLADLKLFTADYIQSDDITMLEFIFLGQEESCVSFKADMAKLTQVLDFVQQDMLEKGIEEQKCFKMVMAAEEIFSNIALYANTTNEVEVKTNIKNGLYTLTFADDGKEYNPLIKEDPNIHIPLEDRKVGGLGIFIVKKMADTLEYKYQNKKNILTIGIKV